MPSVLPDRKPGDVEAILHYSRPPSKEYSGIDRSKKTNYELLELRASDDSPTIQRVPALIRDIRGLEHNFSLDEQGFVIQPLVSKMPSISAFNTPESVESIYYPEIDALLKNLVGAKDVVIYEHFIRARTVEDALQAPIVTNDIPDVDAPVRRVHLDQTPTSSRQELDFRVKDPKLLGRPFAIYNVWKPLSPVKRDPLCLMDCRTIQQKDLKPVPFVLPDIGPVEIYAIRAPSGEEVGRHKWYYLKDQTPEEVLVFRIFDERYFRDGVVEKFGAPHTSFTDPGTEHLPARQSIELRCFCFF